jgi:hypothetical protein
VLPLSKKVLLVLVAMMLGLLVAGADGRDLHRLWDDRCADCHGHSGDFARKFLSVSNGDLQGRHHVDDLRRFMKNHYPSNNEVDAIYDMLLAQANTPPRFKEECTRCHETAASLVRDTLQLRDDALVSRETGRPVREFLDHHRKLKQDDVEFFVALLTRVAKEVHWP